MAFPPNPPPSPGSDPSGPSRDGAQQPSPQPSSAFIQQYQQQLANQGKPPGPEPGDLSPGMAYLSRQLGFHAIYFSVFVGVHMLLYPFSKQFLEPLMAFIFPIAQNNSIWKSLLTLSAFYWAGAAFGIWRHWPKPPSTKM